MVYWVYSFHFSIYPIYGRIFPLNIVVYSMNCSRGHLTFDAFDTWIFLNRLNGVWFYVLEYYELSDCGDSRRFHFSLVVVLFFSALYRNRHGCTFYDFELPVLSWHNIFVICHDSDHYIFYQCCMFDGSAICKPIYSNRRSVRSIARDFLTVRFFDLENKEYLKQTISIVKSYIQYRNIDLNHVVRCCKYPE